MSRDQNVGCVASGHRNQGLGFQNLPVEPGRKASRPATTTRACPASPDRPWKSPRPHHRHPAKAPQRHHNLLARRPFAHLGRAHVPSCEPLGPFSDTNTGRSPSMCTLQESWGPATGLLRAACPTARGQGLMERATCPSAGEVTAWAAALTSRSCVTSPRRLTPGDRDSLCFSEHRSRTSLLQHLPHLGRKLSALGDAARPRTSRWGLPGLCDCSPAAPLSPFLPCNRHLSELFSVRATQHPLCYTDRRGWQAGRPLRQRGNPTEVGDRAGTGFSVICA